MSNRLTDRVAIVTGAGRGIGRAEALALAAEGARVIVNDLGVSLTGEQESESPAAQVVAEINAASGDAVANHSSVTDMDTGRELVELAMDTWGRLDIVVNNAGFSRRNMVWDMTELEWDSVVAVHLKGHFTITRHAAEVFHKQRSGRLIGTASTAGLGFMGGANYSAAKEGIAGLFRTLARDLGRYGVTANYIRPGAATRMTQGSGMEHSTEYGPERIAALVTWLCTDEASYVNGQDLFVFGNTVGLFSQPVLAKSAYREGGWTIEALDQLFEQTIGAELKAIGSAAWEPTAAELKIARERGYGHDS